MKRIVGTITVLVLLMLVGEATVNAGNYVNWNGNFWFTIPEGWDMVNYRLVDRILAYTDTTRDMFDYEVVLAPETSRLFNEDAYLVVTFDSTGELSKRASDSVLRSIAASYSEEVYNAPLVQLMTDLIPGQPKINLTEKSVSVLTEMAYTPQAMKKLWLYMRLNDRGLVSLYMYSPDSTFNDNKRIFDNIVGSLSFENLRTAADQKDLTFTDIKGGENSESGTAGIGDDGGGILKVRLIWIFIIIVAVFVLVLVWKFVFAARLKKK